METNKQPGSKLPERPRRRPSRLNRRLRRLALAFINVLFVVMFTLIAVEAFLQVAFLRLPPALIYAMPQYPIRIGIATDPVSGARHFPPNTLVQQTFDGRSGDLYALTCLKVPNQPLFEPYTVTFPRDAMGFRNPPDLPADVDMVVIGDSFTEGAAVQNPFWAGLAPIIYNLGLPDSGTLEQLALLRTYGLPRHPKTVVLAYFGGNDMQNNRDYSEMKALGETYEGRVFYYQPFNFLVLPHLIAYLAAPRIDCPYPVTDIEGEKLAFYDSFFGNTMLTWEALGSSDLWRRTAYALTDMAATVHGVGAQLVVAYIPSKEQVYFDQLDSATLDSLRARVTPDQFGYPAEDTDPFSREAADAQALLLEELSRQAGYTFIDLTPAFRDAAARAESMYFYGDTHWNQAGHDLAREQISAALASLAPASQP